MNLQKVQQNKQKISLLAQNRKYGEAARLAQAILQAHPNDLEVWWVLAQLQEQLGQTRQAILSLSRVAQVASPVQIKALEKSVDMALAFQHMDLALEPAQRLSRLRPGDADALYKLGLVCFFRQEYLAAISAFEKTLEINPKHVDALNRCGMSQGYIGRGDRSRAYYQRSLENRPKENRASRLSVLNMLYLPEQDEHEVYQAHLDAAAGLVELNSSNAGLRLSDLEAGEPIKIGFCSEDFRRHSVAFFLLPLLEQAKNRNWEIYLYSDVVAEDRVTEKCRSLCDYWVDSRKMSDQDLYQKIRHDGVDILFDLMGYFGRARLEVFAARAAPVQVNYLGYPHTSGVQNMDYRLVDEYTDPDGDDLHTETLYPMPDCFLCFQPAEDAPEVSALPALESGYVTFGSFNSMQKFCEQSLLAWCEILKRVEASRLIIKSIPLGEAELAEQLYARFEAVVVSRERIEILGMIPSLQGHLDLYRRVDIHLDTFPYNGTTTTCEALWQGVPTVTLAGRAHRSRVGCSLMTQVGLGDWVADSVEHYIALAVEKSSDAFALGDLRKQLRSKMMSSPLIDASRYAESMGHFFHSAVNAAKSREGIE